MDDGLTPAELMDLSVEPNWARHDPQRHRCLKVRLVDQPRLGGADIAHLCTWLAGQPVPIIGIGEERQSSLAGATDLIVDGTAELRRVEQQIDRWPHTCAVLVQVLRATADLPMLDALAVESLAYATLQGGAEFARWLDDRRPEHRAKSLREEAVLVARRGDVLQVVLNSPENRNALSVAMRDGLADAFQLAAQDDSIAQIEVSANGPCFSAGGDLTEFGTMTDLAEAHRIRMLHMPARYLVACRERCTFHVHGACIGAGIELPSFAARLVAKPDATFRLPEVGMGLIPGAGGCVGIPRRIGRQRTALLAILGDAINAEQALGWGLIDAIEA